MITLRDLDDVAEALRDDGALDTICPPLWEHVTRTPRDPNDCLRGALGSQWWAHIATAE